MLMVQEYPHLYLVVSFYLSAIHAGLLNGQISLYAQGHQALLDAVF